jgi:hypothetical protein
MAGAGTRFDRRTESEIGNSGIHRVSSDRPGDRITKVIAEAEADEVVDGEKSGANGGENCSGCQSSIVRPNAAINSFAVL